MIYRVIFTAFIILLCYVLYKINAVLLVPGFKNIPRLYTSFQDVCGKEAKEQLEKSEIVLQNAFDFQNFLLKNQLEGVLNLEFLKEKVKLRVYRVSSVPQDSFPENLFIDGGLKDGVEKYSFVLKDGFVFGRVVDVGPEMSKVITVFSPLFYVDVVFWGVGVRAILQGDTSGKMKVFATYGNVELNNIPANTVILTAGSKNNSPFGLPVAYVSSDGSIYAFADTENLIYLINVGKGNDQH